MHVNPQLKSAGRVCVMFKRFFKSGILNHCYQRSADHGLIFYSQSDYLVWFTIIGTVAPGYNIKIVSLCPMPDHIHMAVIARSVQDLSNFMGAVNRIFSRMRNDSCGIKMSWFERPFGSVPKEGSKKGMNCLMYVGNNPVERRLVERAEEYRWTFLAYTVSANPFSEKLALRNSSSNMRKAIQVVRAQHKSGRPMSYVLLKRLVQKLSPKETEQLIDFIICTYDVIDHKEALRYFEGSYEKMTEAMSLSSSKEHDLNETFVGWTDKPYAQMTRLVMNEYSLEDIHEILAWTPGQKAKAYHYLRIKTRNLPEQISKFLHWWPK